MSDETLRFFQVQPAIGWFELAFNRRRSLRWLDPKVEVKKCGFHVHRRHANDGNMLQLNCDSKFCSLFRKGLSRNGVISKPCPTVPWTCFFRWDISVICLIRLIPVLKRAVTVLTILYFRTSWPNWLNFFRSFKKQKYGLWPKNNLALNRVAWQFICAWQITKSQSCSLTEDSSEEW